ncbi:MAG: TonB-dependent receptor plug domain-containing protein [Opitutaceae bacterium]
MLTPDRRRVGLRARPLALLLILCIGAWLPRLSGAEPERRSFALPAGEAERTLEMFSEQAGVQIVYLLGDVRGVKTNPVKGVLAIRAALDGLVAHTALRVEVDGKTGAFVIRGDRNVRPPPAQAPKETSQPPPQTMKKSLPARLIAALTLATATIVSAQTAPTSPASSTATEESIKLSPFTVSTEKDRGYLAGESLVGGRMATELLKTPSDTTVLTKEFLDDIGALNYTDAAAFLTNATLTRPADADYGNNVNFRGIGGGFPARNYFRNLNSVDFYIVERLESARGPNSILFGDGVVGGVLNTSTKRAKIGRNINAFTLRTDSEGSIRGTVDLNRSLGSNVALRVNLLETRDRTWVSTYLNDRHGGDIAVTYRPWKRGEFRAEVELGAINTNYAIPGFTDSTSLWNGVGFNGTTATNNALPAGASGLFRYNTDRLVWDGNQVRNQIGYGTTNGSGLGIEPSKAAYVPNFPTISRNFSLQPTDLTVTRIKYNVLAGFYEHQWTDHLVTEVAYQYAEQLRHQNTIKFNSLQTDAIQFFDGGVANPRFGQQFMEISSAGGTDSQNNNKHYDARIVTAYELPVSLWKQKINLFVSRRIEIFDSKGNRVGRSNGAVADLTNGANLLYYRAYLQDGPKSWLIAPANDSVYTWEFYRRDQSRQKQTLDSVQLSTVASFWKGRVTYVGGVRRDFYESLPESVGTRDSKGRVAALVRGTPLNVAVTKLSSGATFFPLPKAGVYFNYSETFNPVGNGANGITNEVFGPTQGKGTSFGLRFNFSDRVTGSLGYYDSQEANRASGGTNTEINRLWTNLGKADRVLPAFRDTNDQHAKGYELDVVANLTQNFRFRGNIAFPKASQSNTLPGLRRYFAANIAEWDAAAANPNTTALAQVVADIAALRLRLENAAEGRQLNGRADYTASFFGNYSFPSGLLKNVSVGAGATFVGKAIIGNQPNRPFDYFKASARYVAQGSLGYRFRWMNHRFNAQLNVSNLLDHDDPIFTGTATRAATATSGSQVLRSGLYYIEPRKYAFTLSVDL